MTIKAIVFDMGGVVVELGPISDILGDIPIEPGEFWRRWLESDGVRAFEMGTANVDQFSDALADEFGIDGAAFVANFARWPKGLFPGAEALVRELEDDFLICCLSNTNEMHWETQVDAAVLHTLFAREFLSFRMGLAKPDDDIFQAMVGQLGLAPNELLFLDDNQPNVDAATRNGIVARRVLGPVEARLAIDEVVGRSGD